MVIASIKETYPSHLFIGEESVSAGTKSNELTDAPTWIVDPSKNDSHASIVTRYLKLRSVDGTTNFVRTLLL